MRESAPIMNEGWNLIQQQLKSESERSKDYVRSLIDLARHQVREAIFEAARFREPIDDLVDIEKTLLRARRERKKEVV